MQGGGGVLNGGVDTERTSAGSSQVVRNMTCTIRGAQAGGWGRGGGIISRQGGFAKLRQVGGMGGRCDNDAYPRGRQLGEWWERDEG